jgi:YVTN family beta-propeller protein
LTTAAIFLAGCAQSQDEFGDVGDNIASPSAMAIDVANNRMYLVNSNDTVLYDWTQGNFQVLDITDPLAPELIKSVATDSFSGLIYLDVLESKAYVPNRYSTNTEEKYDKMYVFSTVEAPRSDLLSHRTVRVGANAYDIECCHPDRVVWLTTSESRLQYIDLDSDLSPGNMSLVTTLDSGEEISFTEAYHLAIKDNQAFIARQENAILIANLDEAGETGKVPVDYAIADVNQPRGLAVRGDYLYALEEGNENGRWHRCLLVMDISSLVPLFDNRYTQKLDKNSDHLLVKMIDVGRNPREVLLSNDYAFVTNMDDDNVSVIDLGGLTRIKNIPVGDQPFSLALYTDLGGEDKYVYVGNLDSNTISIIDVATLKVVAEYP